MSEDKAKAEGPGLSFSVVGEDLRGGSHGPEIQGSLGQHSWPACRRLRNGGSHGWPGEWDKEDTMQKDLTTRSNKPGPGTPAGGQK